MKKLIALLLVLTVLLGAASCAAPEESEGSAFDLSVSLTSEPRTLDPALSGQGDGTVMLHHLFEGLVKWADNGSGQGILAPGMAEYWEVNNNGTEYIFHLRKDALWSDGEPVTADDFVYAWRRLVNPDTGAENSYALDMVVNGEKIREGKVRASKLGVTAVDEETLKVSLTYNCPYFLEVCAGPAAFPVRKDIVEEHGQQWVFKPDTLVTNGPYRMTSWVHNAYIDTAVNPRYYDRESLGPDTIKFVLMDDDQAKLTAFEKGELDFMVEPPVDQVSSLLKKGDAQVAESPGVYGVCFQNQAVPFQDPRIRQAFSLAIDRNELIKALGGGGRTPAAGYVPLGLADREIKPEIEDGAGAQAQDPQGTTEENQDQGLLAGGQDASQSGQAEMHLPEEEETPVPEPIYGDFRLVGGGYYSTAPEDYAANCEKARSLLAEAGFPGGIGFPAVEYICNTGEINETVAKTLQAMWRKELGVTVSISTMDRNRFLEARKNGDYHIAYISQTGEYDDPMSFLELWQTGVGNNDIKYSNSQYDQLVKQARNTEDPDLRLQAMHQAEAILIGTDWALAPVYFYPQIYLQSKSIHGIYVSPLGHFFFGNAGR